MSLMDLPVLCFWNTMDGVLYFICLEEQVCFGWSVYVLLMVTGHLLKVEQNRMWRRKNPRNHLGVCFSDRKVFGRLFLS